ncbi:hypothetical protein QBC34DRAFT_419913 [Podospora aff. communis PSN243]|uniref:Uncharacterized protein n=1 Tax=Podospora aff. communis PSN243 TaxID=3040156 RepID=A0AAV9H8D9_9PEZI|nr:hypothetical protein QBC34DRAFT_419913 [Podospora aff. communis PSN243]
MDSISTSKKATRGYKYSSGIDGPRRQRANQSRTDDFWPMFGWPQPACRPPLLALPRFPNPNARTRVAAQVEERSLPAEDQKGGRSWQRCILPNALEIPPAFSGTTKITTDAVGLLREPHSDLSNTFEDRGIPRNSISCLVDSAVYREREGSPGPFTIRDVRPFDRLLSPTMVGPPLNADVKVRSRAPPTSDRERNGPHQA